MSKDLKSPPAPAGDLQGATSAQEPPRRIVIEFKGVSQEVIRQVWEQLKAGEQPEGPAFILARSLADHPHWFGFFETIGLFEGDHVAYPGDVDPFLHVNLHLLIGLQILNEQPSEARSFYQAREQRGEAPHEVIHVMMSAFQRHLAWTAMNAGPEGQFDMEAYAETLRALKPLNREQMWQRLGHSEPPALHPEAQELF